MTHRVGCSSIGHVLFRSKKVLSGKFDNDLINLFQTDSEFCMYVTHISNKNGGVQFLKCFHFVTHIACLIRHTVSQDFYVNDSSIFHIDRLIQDWKPITILMELAASLTCPLERKCNEIMNFVVVQWEHHLVVRLCMSEYICVR